MSTVKEMPLSLVPAKMVLKGEAATVTATKADTVSDVAAGMSPHFH